MKKWLMLAGLVVLNLTAHLAAADGGERFAREIVLHAARDRENPPPEGSIFFAGSSSMELWTTLVVDFPGRRILNRGIGGSWLSDLPYFGEKLIFPYKPRAVVVYAGDNDLADKHSPAQVVEAFLKVRSLLHSAAPKARLIFIAVKPSTSRVALFPQIREVNAAIAQLCREDPLCTYVDVFTSMVDAQGQPRPELLAADGLHLSAAGYRLWTERVGAALDQLPMF